MLAEGVILVCAALADVGRAAYDMRVAGIDHSTAITISEDPQVRVVIDNAYKLDPRRISADQYASLVKGVCLANARANPPHDRHGH